MKSYSQRDWRWSFKKIKGSKLTIGRFGCVITGIADLSTYYGDNLNPAQVNEHCEFTQSGLILWRSCRFNNFIFDRREYSRNDGRIRQALYEPGKSVLLQVQNARHWVVAIGEDIKNRLFRIADPYYGDRADMSRYNNDITGAAFFKRV